MQNEPQRTPSPWQMVMGLNQYVQQLQCQVNDQQALINRLCRQLDALNERLDALENKPYYHVDTIQYHFDQLKVEKLSGTLNIGMSVPNEEQIKEIGQLVMPVGGSSGNGNGTGSGNSSGHGTGSGNGGGNGSANLGKGSVSGHNFGTDSSTGGVLVGNGLGGHPFSAGVVNDPITSKEPQMDPQATNVPHEFPTPSSLGIPPSVTPAPPYAEIRHAIDCYLDAAAPQQLQQLEAETGIALDPFHRRLVIEDIRKQMSQRIQFYMQTLSRDKHAEAASDPTGTEFQEEVVRKTKRDIDTALRNYVGRLLNPS
ncbi:spore germination protein GerPC [Paenibacillus sacheonensis]|uniref:Spore germination protein PC n=1 Tax=Paenibacillus sacheonensis TaxID=742054 RepID=A0A7X5C2C1_9BACL|nr:spore germination protein GerPC [Paenibacillus sacheonensis]MBM7563571.1 spore germination protein PC [Paenibacillus sacheonensis]NBC71130.1 hypothetical protein [Paenibacillus sacheonensis]